MQKKQQKTHSIPEWTPNEAQQKFNCAKTDICLQLIERWVWFCWEDVFTSLKTHIPLLKWECAWICLSKLIHEKFYKGAKKPPANAKIHKKKGFKWGLIALGKPTINSPCIISPSKTIPPPKALSGIPDFSEAKGTWNFSHPPVLELIRTFPLLSWMWRPAKAGERPW